MEKNNNNDKKRWGRRVGATAVWAILVTVAYYVSLFTAEGSEMWGWFRYTQFMTYGLGFLAGSLTITDVILKKTK